MLVFIQNMSPCRREKLSNNMDVLLVPHRQAPVVAIQAWIRFGSADESNEIAGIAHLFEHLLFKGTKKRKVGDIAKEIEAMGGDLNAYTSFDHTVMHITLEAKHLERGLEILSDAIINSTVPEDELAREKPVILEEIKRRNDRPGSIAGDLLRERLFKGHPYARPIIGYAEVVKKLSREEILKQYKKYYNSSNVFLSLCGDFEETEALKLSEKYFSSVPQGPSTKERKSAQPLTQTISFYKNHSTVDSILHFAWQGPDAQSSDIAALDAIALIWGQGESSRLNKSLIIDENLVRSVGAWVWAPKNAGSFELGLKAPGSVTKNYHRILEKIDHCIRQDFRQSELDKAKKNLLAQNIYSKETVDGLIERYAYYESLTGDWQLDSAYNRQIKSLELNDLYQAREKYISWQRVVATGIVPEKSSLPKFKVPKSKPALRKKAKKSSHNVEEITFNGLKVLVRPLKNIPLFSLRWVGMGGQRLEPNKKAGIGALWSRSVTEGGIDPSGKKWSKDDINLFIDQSCSSLSAIHGKNSFGFYLDGLESDFEDLFDMMLALRNEPLFEENDLKTERKHILNDIRSLKDSPTANMYSQFYEKMFNGHPFQRSTFGTPEIVRALSQKNLKNFHKKLLSYRQVLCVTGDISPERVYSHLEQSFGSFKFSSEKNSLKKIQIKKLGKSFALRKKLKKEQSHILIGFPTEGMLAKDRWKLMGLSALLSGQGGRLFTELRDKLSLCYTVAPIDMEAIDGGFFGFYIGTSPEKEEKAISAIKNEIQNLQNKAVPDSEWRNACEYYSGNHIIEQQRISHQATDMALSELYGMGFEEHFDFDNNLKAVKAADFQKIAKKYFNFEKCVTSVVHP